MRKILSLFLMFSTIFLAAQDFEKNKIYLEGLQKFLSQKSDYSQVLIHEDHYLTGGLKYQGVHVKYSYDPKNRFWICGKAFSYYRNGNVKVWQKFDNDNNYPVDTGFSFYKDGSIQQMFININNIGYTQVPDKVFLKNIWFNNPLNFRVISYWNNGNKKKEFTWKYIYGKYEFDGDFIKYKKDGSVASKQQFINGKRINPH